MKKRIAIIAAIMTLTIIIIIFLIASHQRLNNDPFLELTVIYAPGPTEFTFIIERDRSFISYSAATPEWLMPFIEYARPEERAEIVLSREEFRHVSDLLGAVIDDYYYSIDNWIPREQGSAWFTLRHNGYMYESTAHDSLLRLYWELRRLSPLELQR